MSLVGRIVAGESATPAGQQAVLNVMQNRAAVNFGGYGTSIEAQATAPRQFSAYPNNLGAASSNTESLVSAAQGGTLGNIVPNSLNYANPSIMSPSAQPNSWVWGAQASGQGVTIGGNTFWANDKGGDPGYDATQLANTNAVPHGPGDNPTGYTTDPYLTMNPSDPNYGDITNIPVAGVNAPAASSGSGSGAGVGNDQGTPNLGGGVSQTTPPAQGVQVQTALQPEETSFITSTVQGIEKAFGSGLQATITAAETGLGTWFAGIQNWFVRAALILLGVILLAVALVALMWDHGGQQVAQQATRVVAA